MFTFTRICIKFYCFIVTELQEYISVTNLIAVLAILTDKLAMLANVKLSGRVVVT